MEKSSWNTMKESCGDGKSVGSNTNKVKESWDYKNHHIHGEDLYSGFSWPPRSYTCSFCKREFRSAQALGGHMNVHRRDRAMLRQSPPWEAQPTNPNVSTFSPSTTRLYTFPSMLNSSISCFSSQTSPYHNTQVNTNNPVLDSKCSGGEDLSKTMKTLKGFMEEDEKKMLKKDKTVRLDLDLEIGLCSDRVSQGLDLELRLGYS